MVGPDYAADCNDNDWEHLSDCDKSLEERVRAADALLQSFESLSRSSSELSMAEFEAAATTSPTSDREDNERKVDNRNNLSSVNCSEEPREAEDDAPRLVVQLRVRTSPANGDAMETEIVMPRPKQVNEASTFELYAVGSTNEGQRDMYCLATLAGLTSINKVRPDVYSFSTSSETDIMHGCVGKVEYASPVASESAYTRATSV